MTVTLIASSNDSAADGQASDEPVLSARKRPKPGERKVQILQALAGMLEKPGADRITTAALAASLKVSEAALYRHFASKAQMFEGLIDFIEQTVLSLSHQIAEREKADSSVDVGAGARQAAKVATMVIQFAEKNPGMARVMVGDALVFENERLQQRMNLLFDKMESTFKQCLQASSIPGDATPTVQAQLRASVLTAFVVGRLQRFVRSGFRRLPSENLGSSLILLLG